jgi:2-octaprenyl-6-methoxyphenol hydroxylase
MSNAKTAEFRLAIIGAGPVGLGLGLHAAQQLPWAQITLFDARELAHPVAQDPRTLALSLGSVQMLQRLGVWPMIAGSSMPIHAVHVSQQQPALLAGLPEPTLQIRATDEGVAQLGAVASYGSIVAPLQAAWLQACAQSPLRLQHRFGTRVTAVKGLSQQVEIDAGIVETFDAAIIAEGGVFAEQPRQPWSRPYGQTAWVGEVQIAGGLRGVAYERFTPQGPAALLPLPDGPDGGQRGALVWCVSSTGDPVRGLSPAQRLSVLGTIFSPATGQITSVSALKEFPLGLSIEPRVVQGRIVRIGNAAQTLHPVAGQGLNLGLRDAHSLCAAWARGGAIDQALQALERQRLLDRWAMIAATDFLARSFTWQLPGLATLRGLGIAALQLARPVKSALAQQMMFGTR